MEEARALVIVVPVLLAAVVQSVVIRFSPLPRTAVPLDLGGSWRGHRLLGPNKTWRGLAVWVLATALSCQLVFSWCSPTEREPVMGWLVFGLLLGAGYGLAELPNSFVKRQLGIEAGAQAPRHARWQYLADQGDSVLGMLVVVAVVLDITWPWLLLLTFLGLALHVVGDQVLHATGVKTRERDAVR
jgi:CDP-diacylglycerol--serine O-phosphatidyltransferase